MALTILFGLSIVIQLAQLGILLFRTRPAPVAAEPDAERLMRSAKAIGVRRLVVGGVTVELDPVLPPAEAPMRKTPAELAQDEEDLLLHSVRG